MALSMHRCPGIQQPRSALFAALTMASQRSAVMSPRQMLRRGSEAMRASSSASVMPGSATISWSTRSCTFRNSGEAGFGSRVFTSARNCSHCSMNQRGSSCGSTCLLPAPRSSIRWFTKKAISFTNCIMGFASPSSLRRLAGPSAGAVPGRFPPAVRAYRFTLDTIAQGSGYRARAPVLRRFAGCKTYTKGCNSVT